MNENFFKNKKVLITGGTGSFGGAFIRRLISTDVESIRVFSRDENKQHHMRQKIDDERLSYVIGDVRDPNSVSQACKDIDFIFHAAALKQVPSCEFFPQQALHTNVIGSANVVQAAIENKVEKAVFLSTDKAVFPINAMGMTKALMEKTVKSKSREALEGDTVLSIVRYGNVMCSRGSVIEVFIDQIKKQNAITITSENMTRFMMSLSDAISLVEFSLENARQGDTYIHKAPACKITDLARVLLKMFNSDNKIQLIGIRHGEKEHETLASAAELAQSDDLNQYYRIPNDTRSLNYEKYYTKGSMTAAPTDLTSDSINMMSDQEIEEKLLSLPYVRDALET